MGWHLLGAGPRPHWGNEAVSVCCSGRLCVPFITVTAHKLTERKNWSCGGVGGVCCPICPALGLTTTGPTWRTPHPRPHASPSLPFGHRQPLYRLTPAAKICVCAANGAWVQLLTRQWQEIQKGQCLTSQWPTHAPAWPSVPLWIQG